MARNVISPDNKRRVDTALTLPAGRRRYFPHSFIRAIFIPCNSVVVAQRW
jgi:hypothetical protein